MSVAKKIGPVFDDQINAKIQRKFDLVFIEKKSNDTAFSNENSDNELNDPLNFDVDEMVMETNDGNSNSSNTKPKIDLDFSNEEETPVIPDKKTQSNATINNDLELGFSLDFDMDLVKSDSNTKTGVTVAVSSDEEADAGGFTLDDSDIGDVETNENATQKTVLFNPSMLKTSNVEEFALEKMDNNPSIDMMSTEEAKANIESTIIDILRPDLEGTVDFDLSKKPNGLSDIEDSVLDFGNTPSRGFALSDIDDSAFALDISGPKKTSTEPEKQKDEGFDLNTSEETPNDATVEFDLSSLTASALAEAKSAGEAEVDAPTRIADLDFTEVPMPTPARLVEVQAVAAAPVEAVQHQNTPIETLVSPAERLAGAGLNTEDSMRFQATIRALREEREEMLLQVKNLKGDSKELEQDNLTLKANLDEAKIEITILRKRHMVEIEDLKYRVSLSEEKKAMADEKAKLADMRREKLEQKVRIDFNQVKQREKELESKLELLSMDVDSQVQSRDQKILELRRKIDALEFNMENASIKEQKSLDDKRKLEDRLNKIMKTLRHSIKNLEDDIDHMEDDGDHQKDKN